MRKITLLVVFGLLPFVLFAQSEDEFYFIQAVDGDTIKVSYEGETFDIDILGVDSPEIDQPYGKEAVEFWNGFSQKEFESSKPAFSRKLDGSICLKFREDKYLYKMIASGLAWYDSQNYMNMYYMAEQVLAQNANKGLWSEENPIAPWDWRSEN